MWSTTSTNLGVRSPVCPVPGSMVAAALPSSLHAFLRSLFAHRTGTCNDNVPFMRPSCTPIVAVAVPGDPDEVDAGVGARWVDVIVLVVVAHGVKVSTDGRGVLRLANWKA